MGSTQDYYTYTSAFLNISEDCWVCYYLSNDAKDLSSIISCIRAHVCFCPCPLTLPCMEFMDGAFTHSSSRTANECPWVWNAFTKVLGMRESNYITDWKTTFYLKSLSHLHCRKHPLTTVSLGPGALPYCHRLFFRTELLFLFFSLPQAQDSKLQLSPYSSQVAKEKMEKNLAWQKIRM